MARYRQTKNSGNSYWDNILYHGNAEVTPEPPTVTTDGFTGHFDATATLDGTVVSQGTSDLTSYGFVWADHDAPTIADNIIEIGTGAFTGAFTIRTNENCLSSN